MLLHAQELSFKCGSFKKDSLQINILLLGWPKSSLGFFSSILQKNPNELFGQPNIYCLINMQFTFKFPQLSPKMFYRGFFLYVGFNHVSLIEYDCYISLVFLNLEVPHLDILGLLVCI